MSELTDMHDSGWHDRTHPGPDRPHTHGHHRPGPGSWSHQRGPRRVVPQDPRLGRLFAADTHRYATVNEYAAATGLTPADVLTELAEWLDDSSLNLEIVGPNVFLHTAPHGRPTYSNLAEAPPNLWEALREGHNPQEAFRLWRLLRALESSGWNVEARRHRIASGLGPVRALPPLALEVGGHLLPLVIAPAAEELAAPGGPITQLMAAGAAAVMTICDHGALDATVTALRTWLLTTGADATSTITLGICEAPRFDPVLVSTADGAVSAQTVTKDQLGRLAWTDRSAT